MRNFETIDLPDSQNSVQSLGRNVWLSTIAAGKAILIIVEALKYAYKLPFRRAEFGRQLNNAGVKTFFITAVVAFFTGMILSLQSGLILAQYNQEVNVGQLVTQTMCREMGPFMTALILAASIGSAYAAEIGTMTVSEEVAALKVMNINPVDYLVTPKLFAMMIMCPVLTVYTNLIGSIGGMVVANTQLFVSPEAFTENALEMLRLKEMYVGLFKSFIFAIIIIAVSTYKGFSTKNGAIGVGKATRESVVTSFIFILITGYYITRIFY